MGPAELVLIGDPTCNESRSTAGSSVCEACSEGTWDFSKLAGRIVLVKLHRCNILRKAARLGAHGALAVVSISRKSSSLMLGSYSNNANYFRGATAPKDGTAPVVMVSKEVVRVSSNRYVVRNGVLGGG